MPTALTTKTEEKRKSRSASTVYAKGGLNPESETGAPAGLPLFLQRSASLPPLFIQPKLTIGAPDDAYEREADEVADKIVNGPPAALLQRKCACGGAGNDCESCKQEKPTVQRSAASSLVATDVPSVVHEVVRSPGQPLEQGARNSMEQRFRRNFDGVRVHTDQRAAVSARAMNALAYTVGQNIVFAAGQYQPGAGQGRKLLAHELAHTIQQDGVETPDIQREVNFDIRQTSVAPEQLTSLSDSELAEQARLVREQLATLDRGSNEYHGVADNLRVVEAEVARRTALATDHAANVQLGPQVPRPPGLPLDGGYTLQAIELRADVVSAIPEGQLVSGETLTALFPPTAGPVGTGPSAPVDTSSGIRPSDVGTPLAAGGTAAWLNAGTTLETYGFNVRWQGSSIVAAGEDAIGLVSIPRWGTAGSFPPGSTSVWGHTAVYARIGGRIQIVRGYTVGSLPGMVLGDVVTTPGTPGSGGSLNPFANVSAVRHGQGGTPASIADDIALFRNSGARSLEYPVTREMAERLANNLPEPGPAMQGGQRGLYTAEPAVRGGCVGTNCVNWAAQQAEARLGGPVGPASRPGVSVSALGEGGTTVPGTGGQGRTLQFMQGVEEGTEGVAAVPGSSGRALAQSMPRSLRLLRVGGRVFLVAGIVMGGVEIYMAPPEQRARTAVGVGGGFVGGLALGAAAGLVCGPGAPVCSVVLGLGFGIAGALGGRALSEAAYDAATAPTPPPRYITCPGQGACHTPSSALRGDRPNNDLQGPAMFGPRSRQLSDADLAALRAWIESSTEGRPGQRW